MKKTKHLSGKLQNPGEADVLGRIEEIVARMQTHSSRVRLGIGDDAALFKSTNGCDQILTCDWFLEGTHFLRDKHPPDAVGRKCLARAVSDVAAMGGVPRCFLLSLALPASHTGLWLDQFLQGLQRAAKLFRCVLAGGDTTRRKDILVNVTAVGEVRTGGAVLRSGARPGDVLFVSGRLGEAELGLRLIRKGKRLASSRDPILKKHLYPEPRLALGRWLAENRLASAMMDLSDGLSTDLPRLCAASGVGARLTASKIPVVRVPRGEQAGDASMRDLALHGGDDYELLFTVPRKKLKRIPRSQNGIPITAIGEIMKKRMLLLVDEAGREVPLPNLGWDPFRKPR
ncbi:MAG TPA: thiamine-phosphate kinase [Candidatus Acidoferrum sp.]|nr:thiamine-phosphate kinase [Candidatus Acidoferrum sp.]